MFLWFENHSVFTLKPNVIASLNASATQSKRSAMIGKNKTDHNSSGESGLASGGPQNNLAIGIQSNSQRSDQALNGGSSG